MNRLRIRDGLQWHSKRCQGEVYQLEKVLRQTVDDPDVPRTELDDLAAELEALAETVKNPTAPRAWIAFEATSSALLHSKLQLGPATAWDREFWAWLTVDVFAGLVEMRHASKTCPPGLANNYGLGPRFEGLICRLWSRGDHGFDPEYDEDPYYHARLQVDLDIFRSHILRVDHGSCRFVSHAFLREAYDTKRSASGAPLSTKVVRAVAKQLRCLHAGTPFEMLDRVEAQQLVREEIKRVLRS